SLLSQLRIYLAVRGTAPTIHYPHVGPVPRTGQIISIILLRNLSNLFHLNSSASKALKVAELLPLEAKLDYFIGVCFICTEIYKLKKVSGFS
ncbi:MAG: hypothetical protein ABIC39_02430, partial [Pseudomonadota bacterium]